MMNLSFVGQNGMGFDPPSVFRYNGLKFHHRFVGLYKAIDFLFTVFAVCIIISPMLFKFNRLKIYGDNNTNTTKNYIVNKINIYKINFNTTMSIP